MNFLFNRFPLSSIDWDKVAKADHLSGHSPCSRSPAGTRDTSTASHRQQRRACGTMTALEQAGCWGHLALYKAPDHRAASPVSAVRAERPSRWCACRCCRCCWSSWAPPLASVSIHRRTRVRSQPKGLVPNGMLFYSHHLMTQNATPALSNEYVR